MKVTTTNCDICGREILPDAKTVAVQIMGPLYGVPDVHASCFTSRLSEMFQTLTPQVSHQLIRHLFPHAKMRDLNDDGSEKVPHTRPKVAIEMGTRP